jgi:hypothetical protein
MIDPEDTGLPEAPQHAQDADPEDTGPEPERDRSDAK